MVDDVIAISGPCKSQIFNLWKISAVIPQTTPKTLLSSFQGLFCDSNSPNWSISDISKFQDIGKIHWKFWLRHHHVTGHFRKKSLFFRDTREHPEHDAKNRLSLPSSSPEKLLAEIHELKKKPTLTKFSDGIEVSKLNVNGNENGIFSDYFYAKVWCTGTVIFESRNKIYTVLNLF